jgi:hypothetical protein
MVARRAGSEPSNGFRPSDRGAGFGERSKAVSEALRTVAKAWASDKAELEDDRGRGQQARLLGAEQRGPSLAGAGSWRPAGRPQSPVMAALDSHRQRPRQNLWLRTVESHLLVTKDKLLARSSPAKSSQPYNLPRHSPAQLEPAAAIAERSPRKTGLS